MSSLHQVFIIFARYVFSYAFERHKTIIYKINYDRTEPERWLFPVTYCIVETGTTYIHVTVSSVFLQINFLRTYIKRRNYYRHFGVVNVY